MLHNSKPTSWLVIALIILVAAVGIGMFTYFIQGVPKEQTNGTQKYFLTEDTGSDTDIFNPMIEQLKVFPKKYDPELAEKSGIVSIHHGNMDQGTSSVFDSFVANSAQGKAAQVIIVVYTAEGDPIFTNVLFDVVQYYAVIDSSRDKFHGDHDEYLRIRYGYLKIITHPETGSKFVILTNSSELTFEMLRNAQIASDMDSIDSYQLFSYSE